MMSEERRRSLAAVSLSRSGLICDLTVFAGLTALTFDLIGFPGLDAFLSGLPTGLEEGPLSDVMRRTIGWALAAGIATQMLGSILKAAPLRARLHEQGVALPSTFLALFWWVHLIYFMVAAALCIGMLGWEPPASNEITGPYMLWGTVVCGIGAVTTLLVKSASTPRKTPFMRFQGMELAADAVLSLSALLLTSVLWEPVSGWLLSERVMVEPAFWNAAARLVVLCCSLVLFLVFYLPARILFLVEDARNRWTWLRIGAILAPLAWHILFQ